MSNLSRRLQPLWLFSAVFILYAALIPFRFDTGAAKIRQRLARMPMNLLVAPDTGRRVSLPDVAQNVALFLPFGAIGVLALNRRRRIVAIPIVVLSGAALSVAVESLQLLTADRITSLSDVFANTTGAAAGAIGITVLIAAGTPLLRRLEARGLTDVSAFAPLAVFAVILFVGAWQPFDFTLDVGSVVSKVRSFSADPWQFRVIGDEGAEAIRYFLFGAALTWWLTQLKKSHAAGWAVGAGLALTFALEGSQIIVASRMPGLADALRNGATVALGSLAASAWLKQARPAHQRAWAAGLMCAATVLAATFQTLVPFRLAGGRQPFQTLPFYNYYERTSFVTVSHTIEIALVFFPLGFVLEWLHHPIEGARPLLDSRRRHARGFVVAGIVALAIAGPLEWAQGWIAGRFPDVTDVAIGVLAAIAGASVCSRPRAGP